MLSFLCVLLACNVITSADMDSGTASSPLASDDWTSPAGDSPNLPTYCRLCTFSTEPVLQGIVQIFQPTSLQALHFFYRTSPPGDNPDHPTYLIGRFALFPLYLYHNNVAKKLCKSLCTACCTCVWLDCTHGTCTCTCVWHNLPVEQIAKVFHCILVHTNTNTNTRDCRCCNHEQKIKYLRNSAGQGKWREIVYWHFELAPLFSLKKWVYGTSCQKK